MGCDPIEPAPERDEYQDAVTDLHFLYDLLRCQGHDPDGSFMRGIKAAHDYIRDKH
jgi:hypothetical protein